MENSEIKIKIREDILNLLKAKSVKFGYDISDLFNYLAADFIRNKQLVFNMYNSTELPPIISSKELAERIDVILRRLQTSGNVLYVSYDAEISHVLMSEETYSDLVNTCESFKNKTLR